MLPGFSQVVTDGFELGFRLVRYGGETVKGTGTYEMQAVAVQIVVIGPYNAEATRTE
ncbi:hypothetical protein [Peribacillus aracenensis]|uniref:hypothetical protein n=1 Tax=Peribacillus aracenensis TaxID=2976708 RepID=UPI0021A31910|nr:hypothetical protein [Peribacillus sp. BBB004]